MPLTEAVVRRLPGCRPSLRDGLGPGAPGMLGLDQPLGAPGDMALGLVPITTLTLAQVDDDVSLETARQAANDALHDIGRDNLRAELAER